MSLGFYISFLSFSFFLSKNRDWKSALNKNEEKEETSSSSSLCVLPLEDVPMTTMTTFTSSSSSTTTTTRRPKPSLATKVGGGGRSTTTLPRGFGDFGRRTLWKKTLTTRDDDDDVDDDAVGATRVRPAVFLASAMKRNEGDKDEGDSFDDAARRLTVASVLSVALVLASPSEADAGLNKKGNNNAYEEMMRQMEEENKGNGGGGMSAESLFKESGGACGPGYEMKVKLVTGAECECVQPELCTREGEMTADMLDFTQKLTVFQGNFAKR